MHSGNAVQCSPPPEHPDQPRRAVALALGPACRTAPPVHGVVRGSICLEHKLCVLLTPPYQRIFQPVRGGAGLDGERPRAPPRLHSTPYIVCLHLLLLTELNGLPVMHSNTCRRAFNTKQITAQIATNSGCWYTSGRMCRRSQSSFLN